MEQPIPADTPSPTATPQGTPRGKATLPQKGEPKGAGKGKKGKLAPKGKDAAKAQATLKGHKGKDQAKAQATLKGHKGGKETKAQATSIGGKGPGMTAPPASTERTMVVSQYENWEVLKCRKQQARWSQLSHFVTRILRHSGPEISVNGLSVHEIVDRANEELLKKKQKLAISAAGKPKFDTEDLVNALTYGTNKDRYAIVVNQKSERIERVRCIQGHSADVDPHSMGWTLVSVGQALRLFHVTYPHCVDSITRNGLIPARHNTDMPVGGRAEIYLKKALSSHQQAGKS